ncbi:MAG: energy transducer TonB [Pseudomonadota bacterium]
MSVPADNADSLGPTQERFGFTMFMSICVHAVLILGVGFTIATEPKIISSLAVTLAQYRSEEAPDDADFIAQANQQGAGTEDEALAPASPIESRFAADTIEDVSEFLEERPTTSTNDPVVARNAQNAEVSSSDDPNALQVNPTATGESSVNQLNQSIASLQAQLDVHRQEYAKRPRRYTLSSASTKESRDALYLDNWRKKIEAIGNLNYPKEASESGIYGTLRLLVAIKPDGTVEDIRILRSSGERVLDEAAVRIVQQAAPFQPFPADMRTNVDVLEIIRTWQFHRGNTFSSY